MVDYEAKFSILRNTIPRSTSRTTRLDPSLPIHRDGGIE
jgi:hypothetical protein